MRDVLVIENDADTRSAITELLADKGYTAATGSSAQLGVCAVASVSGVQGEGGGRPPGRRGAQEQQSGVLRLRTHRKAKPSEPIDIPLRCLRFRGARGYKRCPRNCWQGHRKRAERSGLCCCLALPSYKAAAFRRAVAYELPCPSGAGSCRIWRAQASSASPDSGS